MQALQEQTSRNSAALEATTAAINAFGATLTPLADNVALELNMPETSKRVFKQIDMLREIADLFRIARLHVPLLARGLQRPGKLSRSMDE